MPAPFKTMHIDNMLFMFFWMLQSAEIPASLETLRSLDVPVRFLPANAKGGETY